MYGEYSRSTREIVFRGKIYSLLLSSRPSCNFHGMGVNLNVEDMEEAGNLGDKDHQMDEAVIRNISQKSRGHSAHLRGDR